MVHMPYNSTESETEVVRVAHFQLSHHALCTAAGHAPGRLGCWCWVVNLRLYFPEGLACLRYVKSLCHHIAQAVDHAPDSLRGGVGYLT